MLSLSTAVKLGYRAEDPDWKGTGPYAHQVCLRELHVYGHGRDVICLQATASCVRHGRHDANCELITKWANVKRRKSLVAFCDLTAGAHRTCNCFAPAATFRVRFSGSACGVGTYTMADQATTVLTFKLIQHRWPRCTPCHWRATVHVLNPCSDPRPDPRRYMTMIWNQPATLTLRCHATHHACGVRRCAMADQARRCKTVLPQQQQGPRCARPAGRP